MSEKRITNKTDQILLETIQKDFPLVPRPFLAIGETCSITEEEVITRVSGYLSIGLVREISAIIDAKKIGFRSTLIALEVEEKDVPEIAGRITRHPGVSHNYLRGYRYNIWFTLAIPEGKDFENEIAGLDPAGRIISFLILPSIRTFKLGVNFTFSSKTPPLESDTASSPAFPAATEADKSITIDETDRKLLKILQETIPLVSKTWEKTAAAAGLTEEEFFLRVNTLKGRGVIRRISAVLRHREAGFSANGMACYKIPPEKIEEAGIKAAKFHQVSHCYQRPTFKQWPYSLFCMVHSLDRASCEKITADIAAAIGCGEYLILYSEKEFKKERVKYY